MDTVASEHTSRACFVGMGFFMIFLDSDDLRLPQGEVERPHGSCHGFGATSSQRCPEHCPDGGQSTKSCRAMTAARSTYGGV